MHKPVDRDSTERDSTSEGKSRLHLWSETRGAARKDGLVSHLRASIWKAWASGPFIVLIATVRSSLKRR
jgi:hypothetical protein